MSALFSAPTPILRALQHHCKPMKKYLFQGQSTRFKNWFDLDTEWVEQNFSKREPQFKKRRFQRSIKGQAGLKYPTFPVTIVNTK